MFEASGAGLGAVNCPAVEDRIIFRRLQEFLRKGWLTLEDRCLVVCGNAFDRDVLRALGFKAFTISSILPEETYAIDNYRQEDAQQLSFEDGAYDNVIVHAGLHHCRSPHRALCEMYRVARKNVIVCEAQDSATMRLAVRFGFAADYELEAVAAHDGLSGGVDDGPVPNYIYRWTRREIEKLVRSLDPEHEPDIRFYREFSFHPSLLRGRLGKHVVARALGSVTLPAMALFGKLSNVFFRRQGNLFTVLIRKQGARRHPGLSETEVESGRRRRSEVK